MGHERMATEALGFGCKRNGTWLTYVPVQIHDLIPHDIPQERIKALQRVQAENGRQEPA